MLVVKVHPVTVQRVVSMVVELQGLVTTMKVQVAELQTFAPAHC
jgi:hypothetical protein